MSTGDKISAIKAVREESRGMDGYSVLGLKEAKDFVEAMMK